MQGRAGQSKTGQGWAGLTSTLGIAGHTSMHGRAGQGRAGQGRAGHTILQGWAGHTGMQQGRAAPMLALITAIKREGMWSHLKSSMSTVMRRSLSAKPSSTVRPLGCSDTL